MKTSRFTLLVSLFLTVFGCYAQKDTAKTRNREGFYLGVNFGGYVASDATSQFYNGAPDKPNTAAPILDKSNPYYYPTIYNIVKTDYVVSEYPTMKYDPMVMIGGHVGYNMSKKFSLFAEMNFVSLTAKGNLVLQLDKTPTNKQEFNTFLNCPLIGKEDRADVNIGARSMLGQQGWFLPFIEYGLNFNIIKVKSHTLNIVTDNGSFVGNLLLSDYINNYSVTQGGNGYGFFVTGGGLINMPSRIHLHVGVQVALKSTNINNFSAGMNLHESFFIRCNY